MSTTEFPGFAMQETPVYQGDGWWTSGAILEGGTPGPGVVPDPWRVATASDKRIARIVKSLEFARAHGKEITAVEFGLDVDGYLMCKAHFEGCRGHEYIAPPFISYFAYRYPCCRFWWGPLDWRGANNPDLHHGHFGVAVETGAGLMGLIMPMKHPGGLPLMIPGARCELPTKVSRLWDTGVRAWVSPQARGRS